MGQNKQLKLPPPRLIAIDVDNTLLSPRGGVNQHIASWARKKHAEGFQILVWSNRGTKHARRAAEAAGLSEIILAAISKPGLIVDDQGWTWTRHTRVVQREEILDYGKLEESEAAPS